MKIYLVGGAVRDKLLGLPSHDNDWLVVGATPEQMLAQGFRPVGQDFPVFLHPNTQEEYALARTERKSGHGYNGFECFFAPEVTLEDDLARRDLTINAIAEDAQGNIYDPYQGAQDIKNRILRHVSPAFSEDPLRVLRVARFAAQLAPLNFTIAPETLQLMKDMVNSGELNHLTAERVWQEWHKSLQCAAPQQFLQVLRDCGALKVILPEIDALFGVPQPPQWHPEIDSGVHTLLVTEQASKISDNPAVRFAAQLHDLGKALTPKEEWPRHVMHEKRGIEPVLNLCHRIKVPNEYKELALLVCEFHLQVHCAFELKPRTIIKLLNKVDAWRKPERFAHILQVCQADKQGRTGLENIPYPQREFLLNAYQQAAKVDVQAIIAQGFQGADIREELNKRRIEAVKFIPKPCANE